MQFLQDVSNNDKICLYLQQDQQQHSVLFVTQAWYFMEATIASMHPGHCLSALEVLQ